MKISQKVLKWKTLWHGNSGLQGGPGVAGSCEWLILDLPGPPSWFPLQFPSTSKKASLLSEVQREKYGTICYFGHRCFQLREDIKMFQETQPLKYSNRFPTIIDSPITWAPPSVQNPLVTLHASDPSPWAPFPLVEFSYSLCRCSATACLTHRSKHNIMVDNIIL